MKVRFLNAVTISGKKKIDGEAFTFSQVNYLLELEIVDKSNYKCHGHGFESQNIDLDPVALNQFQGFELGQPVDLVLEPMPKNIRRNWCTGVQVIK